MGSKKQKPLPPRRLRMNQEGRLQSAKTWIAGFHGKNLIRRYKNHYGVDWNCAITELRMLGAQLDETYVRSIMKSETARIRHLQKRKEERKRTAALTPLTESDEYYAFIAGYTENGFAYGLTWEEYTDDHS